MTSSLKAKYHILAILTVAVWGTTFISTKILINNGLSPQEIFLLRFIIAYIGIWFISPRKIFSDSIKDELTMFAAGLTGGTLYFLTENTAAFSGFHPTGHIFYVSKRQNLASTLHLFHRRKFSSLCHISCG